MEQWKDPKCVKKLEINTKNRCGGGTVVAIGTHTGGSITIGEHRKRLAIEKGRDPTPSELHLHVHTHGHDEKSFVSERSRLVHEKYQQILQQQTQTQSDIDQSLAFYQAAGGEKKRRIYGLGSQEKYFYGLNLRAYSGSDASSSAAPVLTNHMFPVLAERVRGLIASPSHVQDNHTDHPSAMAPPVPPPTNNINEVHASLSDDDLHSLVSQ
ncbi:uncharacterized protein LOC107775963 [Nicotiana tabacum]|uniref:Uncharacterized protein LOC107775963 n=1 Tax=Nicotiana tabacum TaxID=4097 RepID=A0AC58TKG7_TOBAC